MKYCKLIIFTICLSAFACTKLENRQSIDVKVIIDLGISASKSVDPKDEDLVSDINLLVYNSAGYLENQIWLDRREYGRQPVSVSLLSGVSYDIVAFLNFGYRISGPESSDKLRDLRFFMAYPDEFSDGIPMMATRRDFDPGENDGTLILEAERLMAKIILQMDRSHLEEGVTMNVTGAEIHGCPRSIALFSDSRPRGPDDVFGTGYVKEGKLADNLNRSLDGGLSREVNLYMLENVSGTVNEEAPPDTAPYLELRISYNSPVCYTLPKENLIYRFILGSSPGQADIRRNTVYRFTITPDKDGLQNEGSWRVDTSAIAYYP